MKDPLSPDELDALRAITTPTVCNAIEAFEVRLRNEGFMDSTIVCRFPELGAMVGYAVTVTIRASVPPEREVPAPDVWAEMEKVPKPWVVVVDDLDYPRPVGSFWGEVNGSVYKALGAVGTVTNGGVRDLPEVRATGFQFFSSCVLVAHAYVHVVEVGDEHGVTSVPLEIARKLPAAARDLEARERKLIDYARSESFSQEALAERYRRVD
jgi:4-hydroxy-4-methyl-2-oxoglutarate aldolase